MVTLFANSLCAQQLLTTGESFTYDFTGLLNFGDGYASANARGFSTIYTDLAQSSPGATYRVELFENNSGETPIATINSSGNVTANAVNAWQDLNGSVRVTVTAGDVFFDALRVNVYRPTGFGDYELYSSDLVQVPEPATVSLFALGAVGLLVWKLRQRRG